MQFGRYSHLFEPDKQLRALRRDLRTVLKTATDKRRWRLLRHNKPVGRTGINKHLEIRLRRLPVDGVTHRQWRMLITHGRKGRKLPPRGEPHPAYPTCIDSPFGRPAPDHSDGPQGISHGMRIHRINRSRLA